MRDNALAVSGLLATRLGGPSVFPYQPAGYWAYLNFPPREWDDSPGDDQYRRGLYTWWQRTFPQPSLVAFDAPSREECVGRARALERAAAGAGAARTTRATSRRRASSPSASCARAGRASTSRLRFAYARALQRAPNAAEERVLAELLRRGQDEFGRDPAAAGRLVAIGQHEVAADLRRRRARGVDPGGAGDPEPAGAGDAVLRMRPLLEMLTDDLGAMRERVTRRAFLGRGGTGLGSVALVVAARPARLAAAAADDATATGVVQPLHFSPRAKRVIHLYQAGGPSHLELFDSKPKLAAMNGEPMPESFTRGQPIAQLQDQELRCFGPQHPFARYGRSGQELSTLLPKIGEVADEICVDPLDADRADQPRPGPHLHEHGHPDLRPARARAPGSGTASAPRPRTCRASWC